ncbi:unnamed protein product [Mytilus edulis]|uniref:Uncharacterized protein n=1 Tax=Mytilus edulis TaxID=6550 RepID=A0A8S3R2S8_MYTED|nr:unnamed protein product [Mytilus edulis]
MCVSDCFVYKGCNAVNYNRIRLDCELLSVSFPGDNITDMEGSFYTDIVGWKIDKDQCTPNPCEVGKKCIPAMYNNHICLSFDTPCDANPCLNNGVCRNKVNGYICTCPNGYHGDHCENKPCDVYPCQNNGACTNIVNGYTCHCPENYDSDNCGWTFRYLTGSSGKLNSPNYPGNYATDLKFRYVINVQAGHIIILTFSRIDTEDNFDYVQVFNGANTSYQRLMHFSGSRSSYTVQSTSNTMLVVFTSDSSNTGYGFTATYTLG